MLEGRIKLDVTFKNVRLDALKNKHYFVKNLTNIFLLKKPKKKKKWKNFKLKLFDSGQINSQISFLCNLFK